MTSFLIMARIDDEIQTSFPNNRSRFITNMIFTSNWFQNGVSDFLKPFNITIQQFNVLRILRGAKDWLSMNEIKNLMIDKTPNTTRLANNLLDKKLIDRRRSETDRRIVYLKINDKGMALLKSIDDHDFNYMNFMEKLTEEEAKFCSSILDKLRE